jgi:hypothetical protein
LVLSLGVVTFAACDGDTGTTDPGEGDASADGNGSSSSSGASGASGSSSSSGASGSSGQTDASTDAAKDSGNTDVGCGGPAGPACGDGKKCNVGTDCTSKSCKAGICAAATATDGIKNGDETDVDCGGATAPKCSDTKACAAGTDCVSKSCKAGACAAPTATDGVQNSDETDVDCGGTTSPACADGKNCQKPASCVSLVCAGTGKCATPTVDGVKNGDETDVDCGGATTPKCADTKACKTNPNCESGVCTGNVCQAPSPTDGVKNGDETDVDCGGATAPKCANVKNCAAGPDCTSLSCKVNVCAAPAPDDGVKNGDETDVDCGGATAPTCADDKACGVAADCSSNICTNNLCVAPSYTDGIKNGPETDVDCGGDNVVAHRCKGGKACAAASDCKSSLCTNNVCAFARSCSGVTRGGNTCGVGETVSPGRQHEDCCTQVEVPAGGALGTFSVDKYLITAGRFRKFLDTEQGNVRAYITNNKPAWWKDIWTPYLPVTYDQRNMPAGEHINIYSAYAAVGSGIIRDEPGNQGCFIGGSYGHPTYFVPTGVHQKNGVNTNGTVNITGDNYTRWISQDLLDEKPLNCTTYILFAAFCAWDGGEVISDAEYQYLYDSDHAGTVSRYPWGNPTPMDCSGATCVAPPGYDKVNNPHPGGRTGSLFTDLVGPGTAGFGSRKPCPDCVTDWVNWSWTYVYPAPGGDVNRQRDQSFNISAPGRFPKGDSTPVNPAGERVSDLAGPYIHITRTQVNAAVNQTFTFGNADAGDDRANQSIDTVRWRDGSFESHGLGGSYNFSTVVKYGKAGTRCVHR